MVHYISMSIEKPTGGSKSEETAFWAQAYGETEDTNNLFRKLRTICKSINESKSYAKDIQQILEALIQQDPADLQHDARYWFFSLVLYTMADSRRLKEEGEVINILQSNRRNMDFFRQVKEHIAEVQGMLLEDRLSRLKDRQTALSHLLHARGVISTEQLNKRAPFDPDLDL